MWVTTSYYIDIETGERLSRDDYLRDWEKVTPEVAMWSVGVKNYRELTYNLKVRKPRQGDLFDDYVPF